jgi:hypothetical protein
MVFITWHENMLKEGSFSKSNNERVKWNKKLAKEHGEQYRYKEQYFQLLNSLHS